MCGSYMWRRTVKVEGEEETVMSLVTDCTSPAPGQDGHGEYYERFFNFLPYEFPAFHAGFPLI